MKRALVACVAIVVLLTGCSSPAVTATTAAPTVVSPTPSPKPSTYFGETATAIAVLIKGCTAVKAGDIGKGGPDMASTATCLLNGRTVTVNSWSTIDARDSVGLILQANKVEAYYARGEGWTVTPTDDPNLQLQLTNDGAALLASALAGKTPPPPDVPGQKASATAVVASLGGTVVHIQ